MYTEQITSWINKLMGYISALTPTAIATILVSLLAIIVVILNKKSKSRHASNVESISANKASISVAEKQISSLSEALNAAKQTAKQSSERIAKLEKQIEKLSSMLFSLNEENKQLREELNEQKKRIDYYLNPDINMSADVDEKSRGEDLSGAIEQVIESQKILPSKGKDSNNAPSPNASADNKPHLDEEQEFARKFMETTRENLFITGKAGTGKSFLLDVFRGTTKKSHIVLAPTGIAAINVNGATLHSAFGYYNLVNLAVDDISEDTLKLKSEKKMVLRNVNTIIIDEISMVRADVFDKIDRILKVVNNSNLPFGGKQILVFGDLFQLPPVTRGQEHEYLNDRYGGIFFFNSDGYKAGNFKFIELTQNHRQKEDRQYFEILNRIREGQATDEDIDLLNTRYTQDEGEYDRFVGLFPTKAEAEQVNRDHMNQLETKEFTYSAKILLDKYPDKNKSLENVFPVTNELRLKKGASVMMVANDPEHRWVNGTLGRVENLSPTKIVVLFGKGRVYEVQPLEFDEQEITYKNGKISYEKVFSVLQYPIVPAYAITIHKSQGQTYTNIVCDIEKCFAAGQAYVALSRCASLDGLHLKSKVTLASIKVDRKVLEFYETQLGTSLINKAAGLEMVRSPGLRPWTLTPEEEREIHNRVENMSEEELLIEKARFNGGI